MVIASDPFLTDRSIPTIWGLSPTQLHDRFWAARGVRVVRPGDRGPIPLGAELYLLVGAETLALFSTKHLVDLLSWAKPDLLHLRMSAIGETTFREYATCDHRGDFVAFQRRYSSDRSSFSRAMLTGDPGLAGLWQTATNYRSGLKLMKQNTKRRDREARHLTARTYDCTSADELARFVRDLIRVWEQPSSTIEGVRQLAPQVWAIEDVAVDPSARLVGPVWVGAGRQLTGRGVYGPSALWDKKPPHREPDAPAWNNIEPNTSFVANRSKVAPSSSYRGVKRLFDIVFAILALLITSPLYPLIALAILVEDGRPIFFGHRRETMNGRVFPCWKFRSMRRNADKLKKSLIGSNQADGPQFYIRSDPRLTRVGRFIRRCNLDELPQFWNVLLGDMSVIGPRPSPRDENQFCPPWREARLSVRPGITGLWQIRRTRAAGLDFQEWIRFDLEYVQNMGWRSDALIFFQTLRYIVQGVFSS